MSILSKAFGLDHPSNKGLLDLINGVGRAIATKAGLAGIDPGKLVLGLLLDKYAPDQSSVVMEAVGGLAVNEVTNVVEKAEGSLPPVEETPAPVTTPVTTPVAVIPTLEQAAETAVLPVVENALDNTVSRVPLFTR
jgi:hypothetical protein